MAPQIMRFLTTLALVSTASIAATNNAGQEVKLRAGPATPETKWQTKELRALMKSDAAKLKNQIKLERMFALASASGASLNDKNNNADNNNNTNHKDKKKNQLAKAAERLRAEVEGGGSGIASSSTTNSPSSRSQPPKQDKEDPSATNSDEFVGFDLAPDPMSRAPGMMRTTVSPVDGSTVEIQPLGTRVSAPGNTGYHLYEASLPSANEQPTNEQVEVSSRYAQSQNEYLPLGGAAHSSERGSSHIRVVFNNNPQFIIGRNGPEGLPVSVHGSTSGPHTRLSADDYNSAESSVDETKVALSGAKSDHQPPCAKEHSRGSHHGGHMEMINLRAPTRDLDEQKQTAVPELHTVRQPLSPPPPTPSPVIAHTKPLDLVSALSRPHPNDEQVNLPLEEVAKSNFRPPLRMVISMRNKDGDLMRMPINLHGSRGSPSFFDLGPKMRIHFEPQVQTHLNSVGASFTGGPLDKLTVVDENTPLGGDVFDPANVKPFTKVRARSKEEPLQRMPERFVPEKAITELAEPAKHPMELTPKISILPPPDIPKSPPQPLVSEPQVKPQPIAQVNDRFPVQKSEEKRRDCDKTEDHIEPPILMPTNLFQNRTLANMFVEFQRALSEQIHIQNQLPVTPQVQPVHQQMAASVSMLAPQQPPLHQGGFSLHMKQDEFNPEPRPLSRPVSPQETDMTRLKAMQFHEQQEDLVVAMMAANASNPASIEPGKQMSMTVITPPRGTSLEEAIRMHAGDAEDRTVAILHSSGVGSRASAAAFQSEPSAGGFAQPQPPPEEHSRPFPVDIHLRKPGTSLGPQEGGGGGPPQVAPASDPDGFASATNLDHHQHRWPYELEQQYYHNYHHHQHRYKRSSSATEFAGSVEPSDRLAAVVGVRQRQFVAPGNESQLREEWSGGEDPVVGAASEEHQNEVESDGDSVGESSEEEPSSSGGDSDMEARSDADLDGDSSESDLDDTPDESSEFDSDDEPYNQVASSERDYNTPSFEIPQIDLSPDSLKQKGCRTVLREVQEIPLNGLEATQADGRPGSGFVAGTPVAAGLSGQPTNDGKLMMQAASTSSPTSAANIPTTKAPLNNHNQKQQQQLVRTKRRAADSGSRANLINSRKVTSIVMTKECLFPDGETASSSSQSSQQQQQQQQARAGKPDSPIRLAPGLQVGSLSIGEPSGATLEHHTQQLADAVPSSSALDWSARSPTAASNLRRRSVQAPSERDFYVVSDSRRNEVAHKMYKPPSDSNPYHSLVYTSKNGADPDTEPDEPTDDSFGSSEEGQQSPKGARIKLSRHGSSPRLLSARERAALQDSEHDDTDPTPESGAGSGTAAGDASPDDTPPSKSSQGASAEPAEDSGADEGADETRGSNEAKKLQVPEPRSFGKSLRIDHSVGRRRPQQGSLSDQLRNLKPGMHGYVAAAGQSNHQRRNHKPATSGRQQQQVVPAAAERRELSSRASSGNQEDGPSSSDPDTADADTDEADEEPEASQGTAQERKSKEAQADEEDSEPDVDPDYNPKESRLTLNGKPKKTQKSFAYVHRNTPKKGAKKGGSTNNDDDFVVSYGRGNVQTEHEDYDSERDSGPPPASLRNRRTLLLATRGPHSGLGGAPATPHYTQFGLRMPAGFSHHRNQPQQTSPTNAARQPPLTLVG